MERFRFNPTFGWNLPPLDFLFCCSARRVSRWANKKYSRPGPVQPHPWMEPGIYGFGRWTPSATAGQGMEPPSQARVGNFPRNFPSNSKHLAQERAVQARSGPQPPSKDALCASPAPLRRTFGTGPLGYPPEAQKPLISKPRAPKKLQRVVTEKSPLECQKR